MSLIVDASVAVEYLLRTELGMRLTTTVEATTLLAPELIDAEVLAVLRREVLSHRLDPERAAEALQDLGLWDLERIPHVALLEAAWELRHNASGYDALYLAAAWLENAEVITADGPLSRVPVEGLTVHNVRAWPPASR